MAICIVWVMSVAVGLAQIAFELAQREVKDNVIYSNAQNNRLTFQRLSVQIYCCFAE